MSASTPRPTCGPPEVATLDEAAASGDRRQALEALRDYLAATLADTDDVKAVAPIAKQLADVLREIDGLSDSKEGSVVDDLAARRAARRADAASL